MRPGRPTQHIRAAFMSFKDDDRTSFYSLDKKGNLVREFGSLVPHHQKFNDSYEDSIEAISCEVPEKISEPMSPEAPPFVNSILEDYEVIKFTDLPELSSTSLVFPELAATEFITFNDKLDEAYAMDPFQMSHNSFGTSYNEFGNLL